MTFGCIVSAIHFKCGKTLRLHLHKSFTESGTMQRVCANRRNLFSLSEFPSVYSIVCGRQPEIYRQKLITELLMDQKKKVK